MDANLLRRVNWLWKHRHTHDGDGGLGDITDRLTVIETRSDGQVGEGAYIHLGAGTSQEIADGGAAVTFTGLLKDSLNFPEHSFPTDEVTITSPGYYDAQVSLTWDSYTEGGGVWITRTRGGVSSTVWPVLDDQWVATNGRRFVDNMPALECQFGDVLQLWVDPASGQAEDLLRATFVVRMLDRVGRPQESTPATPDTDVVAQALSIGATSSYSVPLPDSQADDLLVMFVASGPVPSISGWTTLDSDVQSWGGVDHRVTVLWKVAAGTEGTSTTLSFAGNSGYAMAAIRFREASTDWSTTTPSVDLGSWDSSSPVGFPAGTPIHGNGDYWVVPFVASYIFGAPGTAPDGYPQIAYVTHVHAWQRMWVGAGYEAVTGSVTPGDITYSGGAGGVFAGVLLVKGG